MPTLRVFQVAKLLKVESEEILDALSDMGISVASNLAALDEDIVAELKELYKPKPAAKAPVDGKAAPEKKPGAVAKKAAPARKPLEESTPQGVPVADRRPTARRPIAATAAEPKPALAAAPPPAGSPVTPAAAAPPAGQHPAAARPRTGRPAPTQDRPAQLAGLGIAAVAPPPAPGTYPARYTPGGGYGRPGYPSPGGPPRPGAVPPQSPYRQPFPSGRFRKGPRRRPSAPQMPGPPTPKAMKPEPPLPASVTLSEGVTIKELSEKLNRKSKDIIKKLLDRGVMATINQPLGAELGLKICQDLGVAAEVISFEEEASRQSDLESPSTAVEGESTVARPPVVTIMGHVDHGKTSLLDAIRETNVVATEHGGITQHIGAYHVEVKNRSVVFLDTPGHEAFTLMRARGAQVTDIVVLVVAADDGVKPQTLEAISHARAAGVPIVVAINKVDKPDASVDRVKQQLSDHGLLAEDWGGDTVTVPVSAKQKLGLVELLEMLLLVADLKELRGAPERMATGTVLEAKLDKTRGPVATVLVQNGTLRIGDAFIAGAVSGKVRAMFDDRGGKLREAGPSSPVEVLGLAMVPNAGDRFQVLTEEWKARQIGSFRQQKIRQESLARTARLTLDHLHQQIATGSIKELPIILKGDVQGSIEVLGKTLGELPSDQVKVRVLHSGTGAITETDVLLASASNAVIIGFNVRPERSADELAAKEQVDIRLHTVIYNVTNEIKNAMAGLLDPTFKEVYLGRAEVRNCFKIPKVGMVAGCAVIDGKIARSAEIRLLRDNVVVHEGKISSLRRFKDDASEVKLGLECGIGIDRFNDVKPGDVIEAFIMEKVATRLTEEASVRTPSAGSSSVRH
jgi:translation initiation factor IF-2